MSTSEMLFERDADLGTLLGLAAEASAGDGRIALVEGPAGIGKSALVRTARDAATGTRVRWLSARGSEMERSFAFGIVRQLFEPVVAVASDGELEELLAGPARIAGGLLTGVESPVSADPTALFALHHGLYWLTANLAQARPLVLAIDDVHWCDAPSLDFLGYLGRRLEGLPVMLLLAFRSREPGWDPAVLEPLARDSGATVMRPAALSDAGVTQIVRVALTPEADATFCKACRDATGGNPLLLTALVRALASESVEPTGSNIAAVMEIGPQAVARAVRGRLLSLSGVAVAVAQAAAVLGEDAVPDDVTALAGVTVDEAQEGLRLLVDAEILRSASGLIGFVHPLVRAAVLAEIGTVELQAAHARAATVLRTARRSPQHVAAQLLRTPPSGDPSVVATLREAAAQSLGRGAASIAVEYLERALQEPPAASERGDVLVELGTAEQLVHGPNAAAHLREALSESTDPGRRAAIALLLGRALYFAGDIAGARRTFEDALAVETPAGEVSRNIETGLVVLGLFEPELVALARERLRRFDRTPVPTDVTTRTLLAYGTYDDARSGADLTTAVERARTALGSDYLLAEESQGAFAAATAVLGAADHLDEAERVARLVLRTGEEAGSLFLVLSGSSMLGSYLRRRGGLAEATAYVSTAVDMAQSQGFLTVLHWAISYLAHCLVDRGEAAEADDLVVRSGFDGALPDTAHLHELLWARGRARIAAGRTREGIEDLRLLRARFDAIGGRNPAMLPWRSELALGLLRLGERDEAAELAREELEVADTWSTPRVRCRAHRVLGLALGGDAGALELRRAVETGRGAPAPVELAEALVDLGAAERRANSRASARPLLEEGMALAHRCGARGVEELAFQELLAAGARPRRVAITGRESLTPSERRVAEMAADRLTNREIAQRLFVTQKTVEAHLARAFRKLAVESRVQLASALAD